MNSFYLGAGGFGDFLILLASFYDLHSSYTRPDVVFFADNPYLILEAKRIFPKINNLLVFTKSKSMHKWPEYSQSEMCLGTGMTPRNLDYSEWKSVDNFFQKYGIVEHPKFASEFPENALCSKYQVCIMPQSSILNPQKQKIITKENIEIIREECKNENVCVLGKEVPKYLPSEWDVLTHIDLQTQMETIRGSKRVYSVDSWVKTWSAMCNIKTITYDNVYSRDYLSSMGGDDWGHNIFIYPWSNIEFRKQNQ